jgi:hypothetical protein
VGHEAQRLGEDADRVTDQRSLAELNYVQFNLNVVHLSRSSFKKTGGAVARTTQHAGTASACSTDAGTWSLWVSPRIDGQSAATSSPASGGCRGASVADTFESKYGRRFTSPDGTWFGLGESIRGGDALVYKVASSTAFGFGKGRQFSQTRWRFS